VMLPPYDTQATLANLAEVIARFNPARVIALGDSFHDNSGGERLRDTDRAALRRLQAGREWHWITGNHDPERIEDIGGEFSNMLRIRDVTFRHQPGQDENEIVGHFHPVAAIPSRGRRVRLRCFAECGTRLVLPAFGSLTGGLDVRHAAFAAVLGLNFFVHLWAAEKFYSLPVRRLAAI
jgi:DNA ligase-associated metallophosphoesterase